MYSPLGCIVLHRFTTESSGSGRQTATRLSGCTWGHRGTAPCRADDAKGTDGPRGPDGSFAWSSKGVRSTKPDVLSPGHAPTSHSGQLNTLAHGRLVWGDLMDPLKEPERAACDTVEDVITEARSALERSQGTDGSWNECFDTGVMPDAQTVIALYLLGVEDEEWTDPLLDRIASLQRENGSWGVYPGDAGDLSLTMEAYYALQLHGRWAHKRRQQEAARDFIKRHGGLKRCRNLTKMFLAVGGEIPWSWLPSPRVYSWMFGEITPVHIWDIVMFTRVHLPPMLVLSTLRYVSKCARTPQLREFLPPGVWHWPHRRPRLFRWERKRLSRCMEWMLAEREADGTAGGYHSATFLLLFSLQALGYGLTGSDIQMPLRTMRNNMYVGEHQAFIHQQTCNAKVWNTSLAMQALQRAGVDADSRAVQRARYFLLGKQQTTVGEWIIHSHAQPGAWGFSDNNTHHPDVDDTVSCLETLHPFRTDKSLWWWKGVQWLLAMQNNDGGWSAFEKNATKTWLERLPANDMKRVMADPSTADITGRVLEFFIRRRVVPFGDERIQRGVSWLIRHQEPDGSWFGRWGTTYLYGTWCAVRALKAAEVPSTHSVMEKAQHWIVSAQHDDGGFGESCASDLRGRYVPHEASIPTQTAWGLDTLLSLIEAEERPRVRAQLLSHAHRAAQWLLEHVHEGRWYEDYPTGSAFPGALHIQYHIYPKVWPLVALCHYREVMSGLGEGG